MKMQDGKLATSHPKRTRAGCLTCRHRKKKCDEIRPSCAGCRRNNLVCQWESRASLSNPRTRRRNSRLSERILPEQALGMMNVFSALKPNIVSRLLSHFLDASPRWLSTRTGSRRTDYIEWLSPAISESDLVLKCVLTVAAADLLKYRRGDLELQHAAVEYYGQAVAGLQSGIQSEIAVASSSDSALHDHIPLAVLLLCVHETQNFTDSQRILPHLNAAVILLQNRICRRSINTALRSFLFEMFCYFFSLATFSLGPRLSIREAYSIFNSPSVIGYIQNGHIMGTSQHLFLTIFRFSTLTHLIFSNEPGLVSSAKAELRLMDQALASCQKNPNVEQTMNHAHLEDAITSELYRLACRIHIGKLLALSMPNEDSTVQSLVKGFVHQLKCLPPNSPSHNILCWPLVVAGLSATSNDHQLIIAAKLIHIHEEWQSDIFSKSAAFLREEWKKDRNSQRSARVVGMSFYNYDCPVILA